MRMSTTTTGTTTSTTTATETTATRGKGVKTTPPLARAMAYDRIGVISIVVRIRLAVIHIHSIVFCH